MKIKHTVRVNHNGYEVEFKDIEELDAFIESKLVKDLNPKKVFESQRRNIFVIVYEYYTLYQEVFVVTILD